LCVAQSGITAFPQDSIPLFTWTVTGGTLDALDGTDFRAFLSTKVVVPGAGISTLDAGGATVVSVDQAVVALRVPVPAVSTSACTAGSWSTDGTYFYFCVSTNSWKRAAVSSW
jgi:hypothetical protein